MTVAGVLILGVTVVWVSQNHLVPEPFGQADAPPFTVARSPEPPVRTTAPSLPATAGVVSPVIVEPETPAAALPPGPAGVPVGMMIPALGVDAPVDGIITGADQVLRPPDDPSRVGWWIASSPPGASTGPTVLVGHVDSAARGPGALFRLTDLNLGDQVTIRTSDNPDVKFDITGRSTYTKTDGLPPGLFDLDGPARLIVITCGGAFDPLTASYEQNVVLLAEQASR